MENLLHKFASLIIAPFIFLGSLFSPIQAPVQAPVSLGATNAIETPVALFSTTLANSITSSATTMTLTSATDKAGTALASSTYSFILDEGSASEEFVKADCTSTACTNMTRGLSPVTGTTTVASLQKPHRRGASVKMTDAPLLLNLTRIINGIGTFPNKVAYSSGITVVTADSGQTLSTKAYVDNITSAGAATSTEARGGIVELGTLAEQASSYDGGSDKPTVLQTKNSTSTCQVVGSYNIVASSTTGRLDKNCFDQTADYTLTGTNIFAGVNSFSSTTATTTFSGGTKLNKSGTGIEFYDSTIQTTAFTNSAVSHLIEATTTLTQIDDDSGGVERILFGTYVPANTLGTFSVLKSRFDIQYLSCNNGFTLNAKYGNVSFASSTIACGQFNGNGGGGHYETYLIATSTTAAQAGSHLMDTDKTSGLNPGTTRLFMSSATSTPYGWIGVNSTTRQPFEISAKWSDNSVNNDLKIRNGILEVIK